MSFENELIVTKGSNKKENVTAISSKREKT
jgi:hypothetical protein